MYAFTYRVEQVIAEIQTSLHSYKNVVRHKWGTITAQQTQLGEVISTIGRAIDNGSPIDEIESLIEPFVDKNLYNQIVLDDARETLVKMQNILEDN